jgi:DNA polymerase III delta subunit
VARALQIFGLRASPRAMAGRVVNAALERDLAAHASFVFALLPHAPRLEELTVATPPLLRWAALVAHAGPDNLGKVPREVRVGGVARLLELLDSSALAVRAERSFADYKAAADAQALEDAKNAAAVPCYVEDERDLTRVIAGALKEQGFAIESDALTYMAANVVGDRAVVRGEVEKLITYMGADSKRIRLDDVSACIGDSADLSIDLLAKLAAGGNFAEAERILNYLLGEGTSFVFLTRNLQNYFLRLHLTKARLERGEQLEPAMAKLRPAVFWKHKDAFAAQAQSWAMPQIEQALAIIMTAEAKCKQTGSDPALLLSRALLAISQTGQRALSRRRA